MHSSCILVLLAIVVSCASASCTKKANPKTYLFPKDFRWSTATSSYQIEGATREDGRGLSIWDTFSRKPGKIRDNSTGDVAAGSYRKFREDVQLINKIGLKEYRFSFAWSRILPTGRADVVNPAGVKYYHSVIDELIANDIRPVVTLYHWDLPQALQDRGGWLNREIISWFTEYAKFCFHEFGSKVKTWITVNEPIVHSVYGHCGRVEEHAPGGSKENCDWAPYLAGHHMLLAHAHAYRYFHKPGNLQGGGKVGISNHVMFPIAEGPQDQKATDLALDFALHWFNHPIFKEDYPPKMKSWIRHLSRKEARSTSRLPSFTADELEMLSGSADFLGLNYYITRVVRTSSTPKASMLGADVPAELLTRTEWMPVGDERSWIRSYPEGLENLLEVIKNEYDNPEVLITENGCMDTPGEGLNDITRTRYLKGHMAAVSRAISKGSNVTGYTLWSLIDNFEWADGYTNLFGIHKVDFNDKTLRRSRKHSANFYEKVVQNNVVIIDQGC